MTAVGRAFITPHTLRRYIERIAPGTAESQALADILRALEDPLGVGETVRQDGIRVQHVLLEADRLFLATVAPPAPGQRLPVVVSVRRYIPWEQGCNRRPEYRNGTWRWLRRPRGRSADATAPSV